MKLIHLIYIISSLLNVINAFQPHFHHCVGWSFSAITWDTGSKEVSVQITGPDPVEIVADPDLRPYTTDPNDGKAPYQQIWSGRRWVNGYDDRNFKGGHKGDNPWKFRYDNYDPNKLPPPGTLITWKMTLFYDCVWTSYAQTECLGCIWMLSTTIPDPNKEHQNFNTEVFSYNMTKKISE